MADLPTIPEKIPQVSAPQSRVSPSQVAAPMMELAQTLDHASKETGDISKLLAHNAGLKAVTRDANGNVQVERPPIVGDAAIAYQHAVTMAAAVDGETVARKDLVDMRHQFRDDPEGFRTAAENYRKEKITQYEKAAGPDVGLSFGKSIDHLSTQHYHNLLNQKERLDLQRANTSINAQIERTKNEMEAMAAGGDTSSPQYAQGFQTLGALYGQLVNNPRMAYPKEQANYELSHFASELQVAGLDNRIAKIQAEQGPDAAMAEVERFRADPSLNLRGAERFTYSSRLVSGIRQRAGAQMAIDKQVSGELNALTDIATQGNVIPPNRLAAAKTAVLETRNPSLIEGLQTIETIQPIIADWRKGNPSDLETNLSDLSRVMREQGETPMLRLLHDKGQELLTKMREGLQTDPNGWANRTGAVPTPTIDFAKPDVVAQIQARVAEAETGAVKYGQAPTYLKPEERKVLEAATTQGGAAMMDVAGMIVAGAGDRAPRILSEISKESPVLAHIGGLMVSNGSQSLMRDAADAIKLRMDPDFQKKAPKWLTHEPDTMQLIQHARTVDVYGNAFVLASQTGRAAEMTAQDAFFMRAYRNSYDPKFKEGNTGAAQTSFDRTLQESAGATYGPDGTQYGGVGNIKPGYWTNYKVLVPGNIRNDRFGSVIGAVTDEDLRLMPISPMAADGKAYTSRDLQNAVPVRDRSGYRFAAGDPASDDPKWIRGADGKPFVLDIERLEPVLRKRVPSAYTGQ